MRTWKIEYWYSGRGKGPFEKWLDKLTGQFDTARSISFAAEVERINLLGEKEPGHLEKLSRELMVSSWVYDTELILKIAFFGKVFTV